MENKKYYRCSHCGNFVEMIKNVGVPIICCGVPMDYIEANTKEAILEKHIPEVNVKEKCVEVIVGSILHPMTDEHHIEFIALETSKASYRKDLVGSKDPKVCFKLSNDEKPLNVYAYCNLHGLWKKDI